MKKPFIELDVKSLRITPFQTNPIEGYKATINSETNEKFPKCCEFHQKSFENIEKWFVKFPNCCEGHIQMSKEKWFNKEDYYGLPFKIIQQISFTEYQIASKIEDENWFKEITDYIDYTVSSYGIPAIGLHHYLGYIKHILLNKKSIESLTKKSALVEFIDLYYVKSDTPKTDLNSLFETYQKWVSEFPFSLNQYFGDSKKYFETRLPFFNGKPEVNIYSGIAKYKAHSQKSLIEELTKVTLELLNGIDVKKLIDDRIIVDINKHRFELETESLRIASSQITKSFSKGELKYHTALKKWLKLHKSYFKEISPLLELSDNIKTSPKEEIDFESKLFYNRFLVLFNDFEGDYFNRDIETDINYLPDCTRLDSMERWLEIYTNAYLIFTDALDVNDKNYNETLKEMVEIYGEGVIYPTKRKIEYIKSLIEIESNKMGFQPIRLAETKKENSKSFIANEYALTYIFDLFASGKQIPTNSTEGGFNKKEIIRNGFELFQLDNNKDTFYRAVLKVVKYDLNKKQDLVNISISWLDAVKILSKDWSKTKQYLIGKELIGE